MTFSPGIPLAGDRPSVSQGQIATNFTELNTIFDVDHVPFDDGTVANRGFHDKISYSAVLGADPNLTTPQASLYTKTSAGATELFFQNDALAADVVQLTALPITSVGQERSITTPWGIILKFGISFASVAGQAVTFAGGAFPNNALALTIAVQETNPARAVSYSALGLGGFTAHGTNNNLFFSYIAIGN